LLAKNILKNHSHKNKRAGIAANPLIIGTPPKTFKHIDLVEMGISLFKVIQHIE
jgi:hypothetical protein